MTPYLLLALFSIFYTPSIPERGTLIIELNKQMPREGNLLIYIFDDADAFPKQKDKVYRFVVVDAKQGIKSIPVQNLHFKDYAVIAVHDINGNKKMDRNWLGLPAEPYALSGNPKFHMGPPKYDEVKFLFEKNNQTLKLAF